MLYLLKLDLHGMDTDKGLKITNTIFVKKLFNIYAEGTDAYKIKKSYEWMRRKGEQLATKSIHRLATIAHIGQNHWVAMVLDSTCHQICYGDSLGNPIHKKLKDVLTWWIHQHMESPFMIVEIAAARQHDDYSCGILVWNALAMFLAPEVFTLVDPDEASTEWLKMFLRVARRHNEKVRFTQLYETYFKTDEMPVGIS